jgi:hypothetical protein
MSVKDFKMNFLEEKMIVDANWKNIMDNWILTSTSGDETNCPPISPYAQWTGDGWQFITVYNFKTGYVRIYQKDGVNYSWTYSE